MLRIEQTNGNASRRSNIIASVEVIPLVVMLTREEEGGDWKGNLIGWVTKTNKIYC